MPKPQRQYSGYVNRKKIGATLQLYGSAVAVVIHLMPYRLS
jgi:hypothetical protein